MNCLARYFTEVLNRRDHLSDQVFFDEASSISFKRSSIYGLGVLQVSLQYFLQKAGIAKFKLFKEKNKDKVIISFNNKE